MDLFLQEVLEVEAIPSLFQPLIGTFPIFIAMLAPAAESIRPPQNNSHWLTTMLSGKVLQGPNFLIIFIIES